MDAQRALIMEQLLTSMNQDINNFEADLAKITAADLPGQNLQAAKDRLRKNFYQTLGANYLLKFAEAQSHFLISSNNYRLVSDQWTTAGVNVPVLPSKFQISSNTGAGLVTRTYLPVAVFINHTAFWDGPKLGRIFATLGARCSIYNSAQAGLLPEGAQGEYTGNYRNFLTPTLSGKLVYLPADSHVGLSLRLEKNFGNYHALNAIAAIPIVLIDKKGVPAINFECQLRFIDLNNSLRGTALPGSRTSVGLTMGVPFSKIVY